MSSRKKAARSAIIIVILGLLSKPLGFLREMLISYRFGSGMQTDTYLLALSSIALFTGLLNKTINTTLIPILSEVEDKEGKEAKIRHTNNFLNLIIIFSVLLMLFALIFTPYIVKLMAPGFTDQMQFKLAVVLVRIGIPAIVFNSVQGILVGYLQTEGRFTEGAAIGIPMNLAFIIFLLFLSNTYGIVGLMVTSTIASVLQVLYVSYGVKKTSYKHSLHIDIHDAYIKKILTLIPPVLISVGISDLNSVIDKSMGSTLVKGSISALNYAEKLGMLVQGIFISAITTVMYPEFARAANKEDKTELKESIILAINLTLLITVPATIGMMLLSHPIVKLAYERGRFDAVATLMTSGALYYTVIRMTTSSIRTIINNAFYSIQDTKTPLYIGGLAVAVNIVFNIILIGPMKHQGLALATTISSFISLIASVYVIRKRLGSFGFMSSVEVAIKTLIASLLMGFVAYYIHNFLSASLGTSKLYEIIALFSAVLVGAVLYIVLILIFKVEEFDWFVSSLKRRIKS